MPRRRPFRAAAVAALVLAAAAGALLWPAWPALRLSTGGTELGHLPLSEGELFTISYVHSIDHLPIEENIEVREGRLIVQSTRFRQFGAGMGHIVGEGTGRADGEWWVIEGMDRDIGTELALRVGAPSVDHRVSTPDDEVGLSACLAAHRVTIEPDRVSTLRLLLGRTPEPECDASVPPA